MAKTKTRVDSNIILEDARIIFRNFSGRESEFNRAGDRNFTVIIDDHELAKQLEKDGWNIKWKEPREEGDREEARLAVKVKFGDFPPKIHQVKKRKGATLLNEATVCNLDSADIESVDMVIRPFNWGPINGKTGVAAYIQEMWVVLREDCFGHKYEDGGCDDCQCCKDNDPEVTVFEE